jgi:3-dehydroquinate synthetase
MSTVFSQGLAGRRTTTLALPDGEQYKTLAGVESIFDALVAARVHRDGCVVRAGWRCRR